MVVVGADVHKRTHTFVAVDEVGRSWRESRCRDRVRAWRGGDVGQGTLRDQVVWAIEDCRHLSARLERDLLTAGQQVVRVPPKLMAQTRASAHPVSPIPSIA